MPPFTAGLSDRPLWSNHTVRIGEIVKSPRITTRSPYAVACIDLSTIPMAVVEVKQWDVVDAPSVWGDWKAVGIDRNASMYPVDFRWATALSNATAGVFQVSRIPFPRAARTGRTRRDSRSTGR